MIESDLFRSEELRVKHVGGFSRRCLVVTFDAYTGNYTLDRAGFGEGFFRDREVDAVHVVERRNLWYQDPDMPQACAAIARLAQDYDRVITYGSSLGAYAAIRFGRMAGASLALALSPQYSIDRRIAPFETRWAPEAASIDFIHESNPAPFVQEAIVLYDPRNDDGRHLALFEGQLDIVGLPILNAGHPVSAFLAEAGLLQRCIMEIVDGAFDPETFRREARAARKSAPHFAFQLSTRTNRPSRRLYLARYASDLNPRGGTYMMNLSQAHRNAGDMESARRACMQAVDLEPQAAHLQYQLSEFHEAAGEPDEALRVMERLCDRHPDIAAYAERRADLAARFGGEAPPQDAPRASGWAGRLKGLFAGR